MINFPLPSSKSISNRLLIIKYLSQSNGEIINISKAVDTLLMNGLLDSLSNNQTRTFFCHNAGTVTRFLIALLSIKKGDWIVDGDKNMRQRPIKPLVDVLIDLGVKINYIEKQDYLPINIIGREILGHKKIRVDTSISSQFISALLLVSPYFKEGISFELEKEIVSKPYIDMTISLMRLFGANISINNDSIRVSPSKYKFSDIEVEADWSSAAFAYELAFFTKEEVFVPNLKKDSLQGDSIAENYFREFGIETIFENHGARMKLNINHSQEDLIFDLGSCPDLFLPLALVAAYCAKRVVFNNTKTLRYKECNRIEAAKQNLEALRVDCTEEENRFIINPKAEEGIKEIKKNVLIKTYDDHRVAMSFGILSKIEPTLKLDNPICTTKSFPNFWEIIEG